jgi:hypothetical protein
VETINQIENEGVLKILFKRAITIASLAEFEEFIPIIKNIATIMRLIWNYVEANRECRGDSRIAPTDA